ncbi:MAG: hypothetical protein MJA27_20860 [Pseudanabaenales cyanobacterium]|nr:hypothetical protein [Pseudanabaenales cyanobacterium]
MLEVGWFSSKLLLKGKLLRNPGYFARGTAIGLGIGLVLLTGLWHFGVHLAVAIALSSLVSGFTMPFLLKDVKMQ